MIINQKIYLTDLKYGKFYLSAPMSGYPDLNYPEFHRITAILRSYGLTIINPAEGNPHNGNWDMCLTDDLTIILTEPGLDGTIFDGDWHKSKGDRLESFTTYKRGLGLWNFVERTKHNSYLEPTEFYLEDGDFETWCKLMKEGK